MAKRHDISKGKIIKTDSQGRKLQVADVKSGWAAGFSYTLSWDEACKNAIDAVISSGITDFNITLWDNQYILPEPGTQSVLEVGFNVPKVGLNPSAFSRNL